METLRLIIAEGRSLSQNKDLLKDVYDSWRIYLQFSRLLVCYMATFPMATCKKQTKMSYA